MSINEMLNRELECNMIKLEKHLDSYFDNRVNQIDQLLIIDSPICKFSNPKFELSYPKFNQFNFIGQSEFQSNIILELKPLINSKIKGQVQFKLQQNTLIQQSSQSIEKKAIIQSTSSQFNLIPFTYQIIQINSIKEQQCFRVIEINKDCSIVAIGCDKQIKIYEFKQRIMNLIQVLNQYNNYVFTSNFMQKSDQLISRDRDGSINEDLFISSSGDNTIKFWNKQKEWIYQQSITLIILLKFIKQVQMIKKIKLFLVDRIQQYQQLNILNIVKGGWQNKISKLIFMDLDYALQTIIYSHLNLIMANQLQGNSSLKKKDIIVNQGSESCSLFSLLFIQQKQILMSKLDTYVNFLRKTEKDVFKYEQSIQFYTNQLFGQLINNGEYFITWDSLSKDIQILGYKQQ
ncbi:unnamed protein product [Paramecium pentaurelia]|uniref:Uncharacterized protein n=1 Tax=Paramecium pentaurelia TaxID=43138 RepID=A0A8S1Y985_9CILI|nr:unnamed protein product [Paramecium pentaurelia]